MTTASIRGSRLGIGSSQHRPDGRAKVDGSFEFASDRAVAAMLWGATVRSPVPHARISSIDVAAAVALDGVRAVLTSTDIRGANRVGLIVPDQVVLAGDVVEYVGQPIVVVAADDPERAREAAAAVDIAFEELHAVTDPNEALATGSLFDELHVRRGPEVSGDVVVERTIEIASQDQAPLGTESGVAIPDGVGGLDLYATTQWIHDDHRQLVDVLGLAPEDLRVHPVGMGGAFGAREDLTVNAHLCLLALATGRPVKMVLSRLESFLAHVHRHAAILEYRLEADHSGAFKRLTARTVIDGGAFASTSPAVNLQVASLGAGPYRVERVEVDAFAVRTNNPPAGAMRGFGAVQACYAYEAVIDALAAELDRDPVELRRENLLQRGDRLSTTGQRIESSFPAVEVLDRLVAVPVDSGISHVSAAGSGIALTPPSRVRRGVGLAMGIKGIGYTGGFDDYADVRLEVTEDGVEVHTAAIEVGQGLVTTLAQIARTALAFDDVRVVFDHTGLIGSAGSSSASRQTQVTGGAVAEACERLIEVVCARFGADRWDREGAWSGTEEVASWAEIAAGGFEVSVRYRHPATDPPDAHGQGRIHPELAVFANRAVVDVDPDLGLVRVLRLESVQDVGRIVNPPGLLGQVEGGAAQGLGLALMEGLTIENGRILNGSFTDYLIPTIVDMPRMRVEFVEDAASWGPFGAKGAGEAPTIASGPAIAAAIRDATGRPVTRFPVSPEDICEGVSSR